MAKFGSGTLLICVGAGRLAACQPRESIIVGSIPDDYRTSHPIVLAESPSVLDLPVAVEARGLTAGQKATVGGFLNGYDRAAAPMLAILVPGGALNEAAARRIATDIVKLARSLGVPRSKIAVSTYEARAELGQPALRLIFTTIRAQTDRCGRWPEDLLQGGAENKHYADFGCSYQNNLAAQIANPTDLLGPRAQSPIDAARRGQVIEDYRGISSEADTTISITTN
jgi:pilus assembly protein CpaD